MLCASKASKVDEACRLVNFGCHCRTALCNVTLTGLIMNLLVVFFFHFAVFMFLIITLSS